MTTQVKLIKKTITKRGKLMYFQGHAWSWLSFRRIPTAEAELLLATGQGKLWEAPRLKLVK